MTDFPNGHTAPKAVGAPELTENEPTPRAMEDALGHLYRYHPDTGVEARDTIIAIYKTFKYSFFCAPKEPQ